MMEWDIKTIVLLATLFLVGYVLGLIESAIKRKWKDKKKPPTIVPSNSQSLTNNRDDLLKIRRGSSESLIVDIDGVPYNKAADLPPDKRRSLIQLLIELRPWIESQKNQTIVPTVKEESKTTSQPAKPTVKNAPEDKKTDEPPNVGMVSQINEILQSKIATSPFAKTGVNLIESPTGSVLVYVGLEKYEGITSVPDQRIKALIQEAVKEWEKRS